MRNSLIACHVALALIAVRPLAAQADGVRSAAAILADLKAIPEPTYDSARGQADAAYKAEAVKASREAEAKWAPLTLELYNIAPDTPELMKYLPARWFWLGQTGKSDLEIAEITSYLAAHPGTKIQAVAANYRAGWQITNSKNAAERQAALVDFEKALPNGPQLPNMLLRAYNKATDATEKQIYLDRLNKEFPDARATKEIAGSTNATNRVGKPFELSFKDAISGKDVSIAGLKGKVVVLDFWATWCGPCKEELPAMAKLYHQYNDKGVEFIGVSLDYANKLDTLKQYVSTHDMPWPEYYQGNGWDSEFSSGLGIAEIPAQFIIDADGNLVSLDARGKLDQLIPELLAKRDRNVAAK